MFSAVIKDGKLTVVVVRGLLLGIVQVSCSLDGGTVMLRFCFTTYDDNSDE